MRVYPSALLGLSLGLSSCNIDKCEGSMSATEAVVAIKYVKARSITSLFEAPTTYFKDSVRVLNEQGKNVPLLAVPGSEGYVSFRLFEAGQDIPMNVPTKRQFLLYLKHSDQDTLRAEYELVNGECDPEFNRLRVFYNNRLVHEATTPYVGVLTEQKP